MNSHNLKLLAWTFKLVAILFAFVVPLFVLRPRWGLNPKADIQMCVLAAISLIPNRSLVSSRITFAIFLLLTLFPFHVFLDFSSYKGFDLGSVVGILLAGLMFFAPLPLSLLFGRVRFSKGE